MKSDRTQRRASLILCVASALLATAPASIVRATDGERFRCGWSARPIRPPSACNLASANPVICQFA